MKKPWTAEKLITAASCVFVLAAFLATFVLPEFASSRQQASKWPVMDKVAAKVIDKYQKSSCVDLKQSKATPPSGQEAELMQKAVQELKANPEMRAAFINKVAPPIANKLFECGMIP